MSKLASAFLRGLGAPAGDSAPGDSAADELETILGRALHEARVALPGLDIPEEDVAHVLGERHRNSGRDVHATLAELSVADVSLGLACARGDGAAITRFETVTFGSARPALVRLGLSEAERAEVLQIVREKLFVAGPGQTPRIVELVGRGDLGGLVRVMAVRTALNLRRGSRRLEPDESMVELIAPDDDPELALLKQQARDELKRAFEDVLASLEPRDRNLLRLHLHHGLSIDEIGATYQVHRATAARWLERLRTKLEKDTKRLLKERLGLDTRELESLLGVAQSRLAISFRRVLGDGDDTGGGAAPP